MVETHGQQRRVAFARWCSDIGSPPVFMSLSLRLAAGTNRLGLKDLLAWGLTSSFLVAGVPLLYVWWLVRRGQVTDIHLPRREERTKPIAVSLIAMISAVVLAASFDAPLLLQRLLLICLGQSVVLGVITIWWKISFHAAAAALTAGLIIVILGVAAAPVLLLVPLISWARLELRRHTLGQVIAGSLLGLLFAGLI